MNIILYANGKNQALSQRLKAIVQSEASLEQIEIFHDLENLYPRMYRFPREIDVAVLLAQTRDQLNELTKLKKVLEGVPIILILPDRQRDTVSIGLTLFPRFYSYMDSDFNAVGSVLAKMIQKMHTQSVN